jgi:hypothetical protein
MDEPLNICPPGSPREPFGRFHMQGMKCLSSAFDIEADGIYHAISSRNGRRNRGFVVDIGAYPSRCGGSRGGTLNPLGCREAISRQALTAKISHNAPSEKSRSSKHRDNSISHCSRSASHAQHPFILKTLVSLWDNCPLPPWRGGVTR